MNDIKTFQAPRLDRPKKPAGKFTERNMPKRKARMSVDGTPGQDTLEDGYNSTEEEDSEIDGSQSRLTRNSSFYDDHAPLSQTDNAEPSYTPETPTPSGPTHAAIDRREKRIQDRCHGQVTLEPLLVRVMDTPEFQRLRSLKQLGGSEFVYPGASHSRFEHSIGVSHLAGLMVEQLAAKQPELDIDDRDITCVKLAGLVHDLGHGPFSHMFESFINRRRHTLGMDEFEHENMSAAILNLLLEKNDIRLEDYMETTPEQADADLAFVLKLIQGLSPTSTFPADEIDRPHSKRFLFEIVANKRNGIDMDKIDYFIRDSTCAFGDSQPSISVARLIDSSKAFEDESGKTQICYEEKMALGIMELFRVRAWLHKYLYQHHTVNVVEAMISDALELACDSFTVSGADGIPVNLFDAAEQPEAYVKLGDWVLDAIEASSDQKFAPAQQIIRRLRSRSLYEQVGLVCELTRHMCRTCKVAQVDRAAQFCSSCGARLTQNTGHAMTKQEATQRIVSRCNQNLEKNDERVTEADILVYEVKINYGKNSDGEADNPLNRVLFYNPKDMGRHLKKGRPAHEKLVNVPERRLGGLELPRSYEERRFWVYVRDSSKKAIVELAWNEVRLELKSEGGAIEPAAIQNSPSVKNNSPVKRRRMSNHRKLDVMDSIGESSTHEE